MSASPVQTQLSAVLFVEFRACIVDFISVVCNGNNRSENGQCCGWQCC